MLQEDAECNDNAMALTDRPQSVTCTCALQAPRKNHLRNWLQAAPTKCSSTNSVCSASPLSPLHRLHKGIVRSPGSRNGPLHQKYILSLLTSVQAPKPQPWASQHLFYEGLHRTSGVCACEEARRPALPSNTQHAHAHDITRHPLPVRSGASLPLLLRSVGSGAWFHRV
jgi:hypothetical protein